MNGFEVEDIHTHCSENARAVLSVAPNGLSVLPENRLYSISLHPWYITPAAMSSFAEAADNRNDDKRWIAVGECGLDGLCPTLPDLQQQAFELSLVTAREYARPVVIHCVRRWGDLAAVVRRIWGMKGAVEAYEAGCPLIIHGFRKGVSLAQQLLEAGFCLSLGEYFQEEVACRIPSERLYVETDESGLTIGEIKEKVYLCRMR